MVATHTLRRAKNRKQFLAAASNILPFPIEVISGREEARLIYRGVSETIADSVGSLAYTQQFFSDGKITAKRFDKAVVYVRQQLEPVANALAGKRVQAVYGTSGTIKAIYQWVSKTVNPAASALTMADLLNCRQQLITARHVDSLQTDAIINTAVGGGD